MRLFSSSLSWITVYTDIRIYRQFFPWRGWERITLICTLVKRLKHLFTNVHIKVWSVDMVFKTIPIACNSPKISARHPVLQWIRDIRVEGTFKSTFAAEMRCSISVGEPFLLWFPTGFPYTTLHCCYVRSCYFVLLTSILGDTSKSSRSDYAEMKEVAFSTWIFLYSFEPRHRLVLQQLKSFQMLFELPNWRFFSFRNLFSSPVKEGRLQKRRAREKEAGY